MADLHAKLSQMAIAFIDAFNEETAESSVRYRGPSCLHRLLPASMGVPPRTNAEYAAWIQNMYTVIRGFRLRLVGTAGPSDTNSKAGLIVDEKARTVGLHLASSAETDVGDYANEYFWMLRFNEDVTVIEEVIEFVDSAYTVGFLAKLEEATAKKKEEGTA
ncbi:hypothetical protein VTK73DRAFT_8732 [Phialemonium thermophilum]|uniref:Uncharacterized protein n=1 Tax=Phialemonium thermophilum TaxID=223376 RepID=A0ABR3W6N3_9PEZI